MSIRLPAIALLLVPGCMSCFAQGEDHAEHAGHIHQEPRPSQPQDSGPNDDASETHSMHSMDMHDMEDMQNMDDSHQMHGEPSSHSHTGDTEEAQSEREHIPPDPPSHPLGDMSEERMIELMQMEDDAPFSLILGDQLEWRTGDGQDALAWDVQGFYGDDYNKVWIKSEGDRTDEDTIGSHEVLWDRLMSRWWTSQLGMRYDTGLARDRTWAAVGVQGIAPYWFDIEATLYVGDEGRTAARFTAEYEMLFTQRLVLQPKLELNAYGKDDAENRIGSGVSTVEAGLRLRYGVRREFAPYIGVNWETKLGRTADYARAVGDDRSELKWLLGVRAWF
jgi:copper resistance protein B